MKTKGRRVISYGIITISIALTISITATAQTGNQPPLPVKVTNTDPIPVSGTVNVASSPGAPVSVTGNVNVAGQVAVTNATNNALNVRDLNNVAKTPIQLSGSCGPSSLDLSCSRLISYNVPTGKLLVIEHVSTRYGGPDGSRGKVVIWTCMENNACHSDGPFVFWDRRVGIYLDPTPVTGSWSFSLSHAGTSQKILAFSNDEDTLVVVGHCSPGLTCAEKFSMDVAISGYLIDKP